VTSFLPCLWASGPQLGSHQIASPAGERNSSELYQARDTKPGQTVAVKLLRGVPTARELDLTRLAATLVHRNIVRTLDVFRPRGQLCLAMETADGGSLQQSWPGPGI
jgi:serine/threonine protein kinase